VTEHGEVKEASNFGTVTEASPGVYCIANLPADIVPHVVNVTDDYEESTDEDIDEVAIAPFSSEHEANQLCKSVPQTQVEVVTLEHYKPEPWGFYITIF